MKKNNSEKNILIAFVLNISFALIEVIGGIYTGSTAILSDAVHDISDSIALGTSYFIQKFSKKRATKKYSFGFKRLSVLGALINIIILSIGSVFLIVEAVESLIHPTPVIPEVMIVLGIVGVLVNGISALRMSKSEKILDKTVFLHLFEDLLGWVAVLVVSIIILFTDVYILDPILSLLIVGIIIRNIFRSGQTIIEILLNGTIDLEFASKVKYNIKNIKGVNSITDFHLWSEDGDFYTCIVAILSDKSDNELLDEIKLSLRNDGIYHSVIEIRKK